MAHFAKLDENNIVIEVVVVNNNVLLKTDGTESEYKGKVFLNGLLGNATWVQTSYNGNFRARHAGIGMGYDENNDVFLHPKPFNSWVLDEDYEWEAPTPKPTDNKTYEWNEETLSWDSYIPAQPFDSWAWNETEWEWQPPTSYPADGQDYQWNENAQTWDLIA